MKRFLANLGHPADLSEFKVQTSAASARDRDSIKLSQVNLDSLEQILDIWAEVRNWTLRAMTGMEHELRMVQSYQIRHEDILNPSQQLGSVQPILIETLRRHCGANQSKFSYTQQKLESLEAVHKPHDISAQANKVVVYDIEGRKVDLKQIALATEEEVSAVRNILTEIEGRLGRLGNLV